ncbi:MAG: hypothetical protein PQJ58_10455 [Spirochaetales bacterium]|nr:hypothetical protein [Spirochaetales bacterium]
MKYPVAERALKKWQANNLKKLDSRGEKTHYKFIFQGSTCNNGGSEFKAHLHALINNNNTIEKAWIEIPEEEQEAAAQMCASPSKNASEAQDFFNSFKEDADFSGSDIEQVIQEEVPLNYAGCLCYAPIVNQKWKMALSTMHFDVKNPT